MDASRYYLSLLLVLVFGDLWNMCLAFKHWLLIVCGVKRQKMRLDLLKLSKLY